MHRKNVIDFHCTIETTVANRVGIVTITASNVMDKTFPELTEQRWCSNLKREYLCSIAFNTTISVRSGDLKNAWSYK